MFCAFCGAVQCVCVMGCVTGDFGDRDPGFGNPAMDEGKDGEGEAARGGTGLVRVVR